MPIPTNSNPRIKVQIFAGPKLDRVLKHLAKTFATSTDPEVLALPYIITCAAALEAKLNDALYRHADSTWREGSQAIKQSLLSMSFRGKLEMTAVLLTNEQYRFNPEDEYIKRLHSLISHRNALVHPKPSSHEVNAKPFRHPLHGVEVLWPDDSYLDLVDDLSFGAKNPYTAPEYHEALQKLDKWFFDRLPDRVSNTRLLISRSGA